MPQEFLTQVKASAEQLQEKMTLLNKVILPLRFKVKEGSFKTARTQLDRSVSELGTAVASSDSGKRDGPELRFNGNSFRFAGANKYYLMYQSQKLHSSRGFYLKTIPTTSSRKT